MVCLLYLLVDGKGWTRGSRPWSGRKQKMRCRVDIDRRINIEAMILKHSGLQVFVRPILPIDVLGISLRFLDFVTLDRSIWKLCLPAVTSSV